MFSFSSQLNRQPLLELLSAHTKKKRTRSREREKKRGVTSLRAVKGSGRIRLLWWQPPPPPPPSSFLPTYQPLSVYMVHHLRIPGIFIYLYICVLFIVFIRRQHRHGNALFQLVHSSPPLTIYEKLRRDRVGPPISTHVQLSATPLTFHPIHSFIRFHFSPFFFMRNPGRRVRPKNKNKSKDPKNIAFRPYAGLLGFSFFSPFIVCISDRPPDDSDRKSHFPTKKNKRHSLLFYRQVIYK